MYTSVVYIYIYIISCKVSVLLKIHVNCQRRYLPLRRDQRGVGRGGGNDGTLGAVLRRKANKILENMVSVGLFLLGIEQAIY